MVGSLNSKEKVVLNDNYAPMLKRKWKCSIGKWGGDVLGIILTSTFESKLVNGASGKTKNDFTFRKNVVMECFVIGCFLQTTGLYDVEERTPLGLMSTPS